MRLFTKKRLEEYVNNQLACKIKEITETYKDGEFARAVYYSDLLAENARLKNLCERQETILKSFQIIKEFLTR